MSVNLDKPISLPALSMSLEQTPSQLGVE